MQFPAAHFRMWAPSTILGCENHCELQNLAERSIAMNAHTLWADTCTSHPAPALAQFQRESIEILAPCLTVANFCPSGC